MLLNRVRVIKSVHCDQYNLFVIICIIILSLGMCIIYNSLLSFSLPITYKTMLSNTGQLSADVTQSGYPILFCCCFMDS